MRHGLQFALMVLSIVSSGCALVADSCRNTMAAIKTPFEEHREKARNREWAEAAWGQVCAASPGRFSEDYGRGFKDGFAEFLFRGGDGEPPLVAPARYREARYQNEPGYHAAQDWFAGYRHGAAMARDSGARMWIVGPSSLHGELNGPHVAHEPPLLDDLLPQHSEPMPITLPEPRVLPNASAEPELGPNGPTFSGPKAIEPEEGGKTPSVQPVQPNDSRSPGAVPLKPAGNPKRPAIELPRQLPPPPPLPALPEPVRIRIQQITESAKEAGPEIINGVPEQPKIRVTGIQDAPPSARPHITGIIATPQKD